jgi:ABC-type polysaccharide/polyol phosphate transport system ATPase subunit
MSDQATGGADVALGDACIRLEGVCKRYQKRHLDAMLMDELLPHRQAGRSEDSFWALSGIDLEVRAGETVALLGKNGSGKSTMLGLLTGAIRPTEGKVSIRGRVAPVLALGVGFEPDMSAVENALLTSSLLGIDASEVARVMEDIISFADLGDFLDTPVRHYSSGMLARLGFAVAMHVERDILLVDEVLAVGDQGFQQKCIARIHELKQRGFTLLIATHDLETAEKLCDRGIWLESGRIRLDAPIGETLREYSASG